MSLLKDFDHLKIQMKDVESATNNFDSTKVIGSGGFGKVYRGELSTPKGQITVAFKRLDRRYGQGNIEFWKEVMMLSKYKHENLISLLHFCIEGDDMILVYEYASRGSLDRYLSDANTLTWIQRLKICVGAALGIHFLHDPKETHQRVIHRDIKSANILLNENWTAKLSDFGLSKVSLANEGNSYLVSHVVGTPGYCDPLYWELGFLSKESDVYSFGVVLFEILCGKLCYEYFNHKLSNILVHMWRQCYNEKRLDEIILPGLKEQMDPGSLKLFSAIAYRCINRSREERPTMAEIVKELEFSLELQKVYENSHNDHRLKFESRRWPRNRWLPDSGGAKLLLQENSEILSRCIKENLGFKDRKPVAASVIYKCLWHTLDYERTATTVFIIKKIRNALVEGDEDVTLPYWLSNVSAVLCLLPISERTGVSTLPIWTAAQRYTPHKYISLEDGISPMEEQLTDCMGKIFRLIRDNLTKEISPLLQAPRNQRVLGGKPPRSPSDIPQQAAGSQWEKILELIDSLIERLRGNHVPLFFIRKLTTQVFSFINISLFNSFLLRRECCTFSNGEYVKSGLAELEKWIAYAKEKFAGQSWHELNYTRQAVGFLVIKQKHKKSLEEIRNDLCPALSVRQIYRISTMYWDDKYGTQSVSEEVVAEMKEMLNKDTQNLTSNSFLLDDDLSIPFSAEDIYMTIPAIDPTDIEAPAFLSEYPAAQFLLQNPK